jgi:hypothetical protein
MVSSGMLRRVVLVRTDVSEEPSASFIRVTRIGELGTTQAASSNRHAAKKYQVRKEARMEFRIVDTVWLGRGGEDSSLVFKWSETKRGPSLGRRLAG